MDAAGRARITGFGLATVCPNLGSTRNAPDEHEYSVRWTAPEILDGRGTYSEEADVFSFAMVMIEVGHGLYITCGALAYCSFTSMSDIHRRGSFQWFFTTRGYVFNNTGRAPLAAGTSRTHGKFVDVNATVLASWPPFAPGGFRSFKNSSYSVSLSFILVTLGLTVSSA